MGHVNFFSPKTLTTLLKNIQFSVFGVLSYGGLDLENVLGKPTQRLPATHAQSAAAAQPVENGPSIFRRLASPIVDVFLYRYAKVGISLEAFARRPMD